MIRILLVALVLSCLAAPATAGPAAGSLYLSFDPTERVETLSITALEPFQFYLVADIDPGEVQSTNILGYESQVRVDPGVLFSAIEFQPSTSLNIGGGFADGHMDLIVGMGSCSPIDQGPLVLVEYTGLLLEPSEGIFITLGPTDPSSFNDVGPGFYTCETRELHPFADWSTSQLKVSSSTVSTTTSSFGAIKALY